MKPSEINTASHWVALLKREADCPICLHTLVNPVTTSCYHTFCRTCIHRVLNDNRSVCPLCKKKITRRGTTANARVNSLVQRVDAVVNAFKNESGVDVKCHRGDTATPLKIRKCEEKEKASKDPESSAIGRECVPLDEIAPSVARFENVSPLDKEADPVRSLIEESAPASALLSESYNDIEHLSISQNVQADNTSSRRKSSGGLSMSLMKHKPLLPAHTPKSPVKKVKEWLGMGEGAPHPLHPSDDVAKTPSNGDLVTAYPDDKFNSSNWDGNGSDKLSTGRQYGKRVYGNSRMSGDLFTYPSKERKSKKPIIISDDDDDGKDEILVSDAGDVIPDSCPVEVNDTFDKLVSDLKQKSGNKKNQISKRSPTPKTSIQGPDRNDITLFESLPLPVDNESGRKNNISFSSKEGEEISRKCGFNSETRLRRKRKLYAGEGIITNVDKKGKTLVTELAGNNAPKDDPLLFDETDGNNLPAAHAEASKQGSKLALEKSPSSKLAVVPDIVEQAKGNKSTPKGGRKRCSDVNVTCPSPGWSRLRSAHKDFESKKKSTALPALNVSGGDPCSTSSSKQNSARKSFESAKDDFPMSIPCIDDDESCIVPDFKKQKLNTSSITMKDNNKDLKKKVSPTASAPVIVHCSNISSTVSSSATPLKNVGLTIPRPEKTTGTPSSKLCVFLQTPRKTSKETSPLKENKSGVSTSCTPPEKCPSDAVTLESSQHVRSTPVKSPNELGVRDVLEQGKAVPVSLLKGSKLAVPEEMPLSLKSLPSPTSKLPSTPIKVTSVKNVLGVIGIEECHDPINKTSPLKVGEESQIVISPSVEKVKGYLEVSCDDREKEVDNSFSSCRKTNNRLSITGLNHIPNVRSPRKSQNQKAAIPVLPERKTFSLETSTEDLSDLAHLRESTEDQLNGIRTGDAVDSTALVHDCQRNRSFAQEKKFDAGMSVNKSIDRLSVDVERENNSKHISPVFMEKSIKKNSLHKKHKSFVPVFKMGPLNKKGPHSGRRVKFYVLGNMRCCGGTIKTSEVGVDTGTSKIQTKLPEVPKEALGKCVDVGVQTIFSPGKSESVPLVEKNHCAIESDRFNKSILVSPLHSAIDENFNSLGIVQGEQARLSGEIKGTQLVCSRDVSVSPTFSTSHVDFGKGLSVFQRSSRKLMPHEVDQDMPHSVVESSLELIPDTERSGLKVQGVQRSMHQRSHLKQKLPSRNFSTKKAVCQLFSNNGGEMSRGEIALPLSCTQISKAQEEPHSTKAEVSGSEEKEVVFLSSDSTSDHEGEEIAKNLKRRRSLRTQRLGKPDSGGRNSRFSPIQEESLPKDFGGDSSIAHYGEDLDSEEMDRKLQMIVANIDADMNIRKGKDKSGDDLVSLKDDSDKDIVEVPFDSEPIYPSTAPETNPLPLTCVAESESEGEEEKNNDEEQEKETKLEDDVLKDGSLPLVKDCSGEESDFFIEGSQKEAETVEKPVVVKKPPMSLVTSGLQMSDVAQVKRMVQMFNLQFSPKFCAEGDSVNTPCTTHVVTKTDENGRTSCTFKYLCGVVTGCWIVSIQWVNDSLKAGKLLDEAPYEALDDSGHSGPFIARNSSNKLFKDLQFYCQEPILETIGQMTEIINLGGGKVVPRIEEFSGKKGLQFVVVDASANENQEFFSRMCQCDIAVVTSEWIVESIGQYKLQPLVGYVVNLSANLTSYSQHREALLAMGYNEDILGTEEDQMAFIRDDDDEDIESCTEDAI